MITSIILVKNEEENIVDCLESVKFCDEIIVIDDESSDRTAELSKMQGAKILIKGLENNFSKQRNYGLEVAENDWVLFVDADERISKPLANEIIKAVRENKRDGFYIPRVDNLFGKKLRHGELSGKKFLRLGKKDNGKWTGKVHEIWDIKGNVGNLKNPIMHYPHQSLSEFISEINFYTTLRAEELFKQGKSAEWYTILFFAKGKFFYTYFLKLGFLDGLPGLILSVIMSFHSFLTRGKLYLLTHKTK